MAKMKATQGMTMEDLLAMAAGATTADEIAANMERAELAECIPDFDDTPVDLTKDPLADCIPNWDEDGKVIPPKKDEDVEKLKKQEGEHFPRFM